MNGTNEHEGTEKKKTVSIDRAWELVQDIHKLEDENESLREQLAKERDNVEVWRNLAIDYKTELLKERELNEFLKKGIQRGDELYAHLKFDDEPFTPYQLALQQIEKECALRKELVLIVEELFKFSCDRINQDSWEGIQSVIQKSKSLDEKK